MDAFQTNNLYRVWRAAVDKRLHQIYCITIEDAGIDEDYLMNHWRSNEPPFEFVDWFAIKYDLDPISSLVLSQEQGR
jgi:hypothetical protein